MAEVLHQLIGSLYIPLFIGFHTSNRWLFGISAIKNSNCVNFNPPINPKPIQTGGCLGLVLDSQQVYPSYGLHILVAIILFVLTLRWHSMQVNCDFLAKWIEMMCVFQQQKLVMVPKKDSLRNCSSHFFNVVRCGYPQKCSWHRKSALSQGWMGW